MSLILESHPTRSSFFPSCSSPLICFGDIPSCLEVVIILPLSLSSFIVGSSNIKNCPFARFFPLLASLSALNITVLGSMAHGRGGNGRQSAASTRTPVFFGEALSLSLFFQGWRPGRPPQECCERWFPSDLHSISRSDDGAHLLGAPQSPAKSVRSHSAFIKSLRSLVQSLSLCR